MATRLFALALCSLVSIAWSAPTSLDAAVPAFVTFKHTFGKTYASAEEEVRRFEAFQASVREVAEINAQATSWRAGLNQFSDLTWDEFRSTILMDPQDCSATHKAGGHELRLKAPPSIDWRDYGALNAVKNQGACGSCWTFSTTGCLESHVYLKTGVMLNISEQQLVDCASAFNNHGCNGGLPSQAYEFIRFNGGIDSEKAYPYTAKTAPTCSFQPDGVVAKVSDVVNITQYDEAELLDAVGSIGPVSIAFEVAPDFRHYVGGIYDGECHTDPQHVNHAVVAVGYGSDESGAGYWTVRNSWGPAWGEAGHFKIARGVNKCGLAVCASYPVV